MSSALCSVCNTAASTSTCKCSEPPAPLCGSCIVEHFSSPGFHSLESPSATATLNQFCSQCFSQQPETMCCCGTGEVLLCRGCIVGHNSKFPDRMHIILPIKAREFASAPGYLERLTKRQQNLQLAIKEGYKNITRISKCEQKIIERVEKVLQEITHYRENAIRELHEYKAQLELKINEARAEVETHLYEDTYIPEAAIARAIWNFEPGRMDMFAFKEIGEYQVEMTKGLIPKEASRLEKTETAAEKTAPARVEVQQLPAPAATLPSVPQPITEILPRPVSAPFISPALSNPQLAWMDPKAFAWYNFSNQALSSKVTLSHANCVAHISSAAVLTNGKILVCGKRNPASAVAYIINPANGKVTQTGNMQKKRWGHGMQVYGESVFVFGGKGDTGTIAASEIYSVDLLKWKGIRDMITPRSHFNPCLWGDFVYIFGGKDTQNCEMYDIMQNAYIPLSIKMKKAGQTSSAVHGSDIVLLQPGKVFRWRIGDPRFKLEKNRASENSWGSMNPVIVKNKIFVSMFYEGRVESFDT